MSLIFLIFFVQNPLFRDNKEKEGSGEVKSSTIKLALVPKKVHLKSLQK